MSSTASSSAAVQANTNVNTKPSQAQRKRGRKQATTNNNGDFSIYGAPLKPKSQVVSGFHLDALTSRASAEKAAAAKSPAVETSKEVKMKDAPLPPELVLPFAGVAAAPSGQRVTVLSGSTNTASVSRQVSSTFSATSSKSSLTSATTASRNSRGPAARPSGPWGNTGPYTYPAEREEKQTTPPPTKAPSADKTAVAAPSTDEAGWIQVTSKNASKNAAPVGKTPAPLADVHEAPKMSRRQKKKEAAALATALAVPDVSTPAVSSVTSPLSPEIAPKQQEKGWSTVSSKKSGKKAPVPAEDPYIWTESKSAVPDVKVTARPKKNKAPIPQTDAHFPALEAPKIKTSPLTKPGNIDPAKLQLSKPVAVLKITKDVTASEPTEKIPLTKATPAVPQLDKLIKFTGPALDSVKSTLTPVVLETMPTPMVALPASVVVLPAPIVTAPKKKKSGAAQKKAKKALAAAEALAAKVAMAEPAAPIQQTAAVQVAEVDSSVDEKDNSSSVSENVPASTAPHQTVAEYVTKFAPPAIEESSAAEDISSVVPETTQDVAASEQALEVPFIAATEEDDLTEAVVQVTTVSLKSLVDMAMSDDRFSLQFGFDDIFEDTKLPMDMKMTDSRFSLQHGLEDLIEEVSATDVPEPCVPIMKPKTQIALPELDADVFPLSDIVDVEIFPTDAQDFQEIEANESSPPVAESIIDATTNVSTSLVDIRINQLHMGGISISEILEGVAREDTTDATYSKEHIATVFISCANREREMVGMGPSMGTSKVDKVLRSPILQNIVRVGRTKLADFLALLDFETERTTLPGVVQACIVSAEKEMASRRTMVGKTVAKALASYMESKM